MRTKRKGNIGSMRTWISVPAQAPGEVLLLAEAMLSTMPNAQDLHLCRDYAIRDDVGPQCDPLASARDQAGPSAFGQVSQPVAGGDNRHGHPVRGSRVVLPDMGSYPQQVRKGRGNQGLRASRERKLRVSVPGQQPAAYCFVGHGMASLNRGYAFMDRLDKGVRVVIGRCRTVRVQPCQQPNTGRGGKGSSAQAARPAQYRLYGRNLPDMVIFTRSPFWSGCRSRVMSKSMALMMPSPNSSWIISFHVVPYTDTSS